MHLLTSPVSEVLECGTSVRFSSLFYLFAIFILQSMSELFDMFFKRFIIGDSTNDCFITFKYVTLEKSNYCEWTRIVKLNMLFYILSSIRVKQKSKSLIKF